MDRFLVNNITRMRVHVGAVFLAYVILMLVSCSSHTRTPLKKSYDFVYTAEQTYIAAVEAVQLMDERGQLTDKQKAEIVAVAEKYFTSVHVAKAALVAYKTAEEAGEDTTATNVALEAAVSAMQVLEQELVRLLMVANNGS